MPSYMLLNITPQGIDDAKLGKFRKSGDRYMPITDEALPEILRNILLESPEVALRNDMQLYDDVNKSVENFHLTDAGRNRPSAFLDNLRRVVVIQFNITLDELNSEIKKGGAYTPNNLEFLKQHIVSINASSETSVYKHGGFHERFPFTVDIKPVIAISPPNQKQPILDALDQYINRIERYENDFKHGFWFFKQSRSENRKANYYLAKQLRDELSKPDASISNVFFNLDGKRKDLFKDKKLDENADRGINSAELKNIIALANNTVREQPAFK